MQAEPPAPDIGGESRIESLRRPGHPTLRVRVWDGGPGAVGSDRRDVLIFLNGLESHGLWAAGLARRAAARGFRFVALDRRGSGVNRDISGKSADWLDDVAFVCESQRRSGFEKICLVGQCFGARLAIGAAIRRPDLVDRLILLSAGLEMLVDLSLGRKILVALGGLSPLPLRLPSPISDDRWLTRDPKWLEYIARDPLRLRRVEARDFYSGHRLLNMIRSVRSPLQKPCLALFCDDDRLVDVGRTIELLGRLFADRLTVETIAGADHVLLFGRASEKAVDMILRGLA